MEQLGASAMAGAVGPGAATSHGAPDHPEGSRLHDRDGLGVADGAALWVGAMPSAAEGAAGPQLQGHGCGQALHAPGKSRDSVGATSVSPQRHVLTGWNGRVGPSTTTASAGDGVWSAKSACGGGRLSCGDATSAQRALAAITALAADLSCPARESGGQGVGAHRHSTPGGEPSGAAPTSQRPSMPSPVQTARQQASAELGGEECAAVRRRPRTSDQRVLEEAQRLLRTDRSQPDVLSGIRLPGALGGGLAPRGGVALHAAPRAQSLLASAQGGGGDGQLGVSRYGRTLSRPLAYWAGEQMVYADKLRGVKGFNPGSACGDLLSKQSTGAGGAGNEAACASLGEGGTEQAGMVPVMKWGCTRADLALWKEHARPSSKHAPHRHA